MGAGQISVADAAAQLGGVSSRRILAMLGSGQLAGVKRADGTWAVDRASVTERAATSHPRGRPRTDDIAAGRRPISEVVMSQADVAAAAGAALAGIDIEAPFGERIPAPLAAFAAGLVAARAGRGIYAAGPDAAVSIDRGIYRLRRYPPRDAAPELHGQTLPM